MFGFFKKRTTTTTESIGVGCLLHHVVKRDGLIHTDSAAREEIKLHEETALLTNSPVAGVPQ